MLLTCTTYACGFQYLSPDEKWTNVKPHIDQLRVFGATAFEDLDATRRPDGKRARRFRVGIYLGKKQTIDPRNPAMRLYIPHRNQIFVRKSVILDETLSHNETRLSGLRNVIPSVPPFFDRVDNRYERNWFKNGEM